MTTAPNVRHTDHLAQAITPRQSPNPIRTQNHSQIMLPDHFTDVLKGLDDLLELALQNSRLRGQIIAHSLQF